MHCLASVFWGKGWELVCNAGRVYFFPEETHEFYDAVNALMEFVFSALLDICDAPVFYEGCRQHISKSIV